MPAAATPLRETARRMASATGALSLRHRLRNRDTLTVAMFHRVVAPGTAAASHADPRYALDAPLFAGLLRWFVRHYSVVSLADVLAAASGGPALPTRALLLTFDDGWADNREVALPLLQEMRLPSVVFVAAEAVADPRPHWWQETLLRALRDGRADAAALWRAAGRDGQPTDAMPPELALLLAWAALDAADRERRLAPWHGPEDGSEGRHMMRAEHLAGLREGGMAVGSHSMAHLPQSLVDEPDADLAAAASALASLTGKASLPGFAFPHGRYDARALAAAWRAGHRLVFTSDACLNPAPAGRPASPLLGRVSIEARGIVAPDGRLDPSRLETWMFHRPIRRLDPGPATVAGAA